MSNIVIGVDYSITSPAICIHKGESFHINNCEFLYLTSVKKYSGPFMNGNLNGYLHSKSMLDIERFDYISDVFINRISGNNVSVGIENYSFASKGKVFNLAENTGLLKYKLYSRKIPFDVYAPGMIKKFAVNKGNADKEMMVDGFIEETGIHFNDILGCKTKTSAPITDLVDSYWICKYHFNQIM